MRLPLKTVIAGKKTVSDWYSIRATLANFKESNLWNDVFDEYFLSRLNGRYLLPIQRIKEQETYNGEGFAIMTIICSLIEFLETTYQGINYRFIKRGDPPIGKFEYCVSSQVFINFLTTHEPFRKDFDIKTAEEFYSNVRCSLLHEARTSGAWVIKGKSLNGLLIQKKTTQIIAYRDNFYAGILKFIDNYKIHLMGSNTAKEAFLRKFDKLCDV